MSDEIVVGSWVWVDAEAYFRRGKCMEWAEVTSISVGATPYPVKVRFKNELTGQYKFSECVAVSDCDPEA